jgi:isoleucyl-tRNA synthetase
MKIQPAGPYKIPESEKEIQQWWEEAGIYQKVKSKKGKSWYFLDGPPYASGSIHLGTAWNKIIKDAILRYKTMRGYNVRRQPGWDCHGLPIEVKVEELLGIKSKKEIEERIGIERFVEECKNWALKHVATMTEEFKRLGVWMDWDAPYMTLTDDYMECAWWTLKRAHEKGLLEKSLKVIHWCPRCETALAEHEVRGEYEDRMDPSIYVRFKIRGEDHRYLLVWTTTPWTLPADLAVCVHPDFMYVEVQVGEDRYILAEGLLERVALELGWKDYRILERRRGSQLEGIEYEHPLLEEVPKQREFKHRVILGEHVTLEEGTGCVHTAPGHGEEDFVVGQRYGLPAFCPVDATGRFTAEAGKYAGIYVKDADKIILSDLKAKGLLVKEGTIIHSYPHCWRCHTPLLFRATEQWFLRTSKIKELLLEKNSKVEWFPAWVRERYINGVESVGDWCLSRQRYWGIPMPIWVCQRCGNEILIGSRKELEEKGGRPRNLHRPAVDEVVLKCEKCGGEMRRIPDVLDVWFDSSIAAWASLGYPARTSELSSWPSDFITEGEDQVTKWFYAQQVSSVVAFGDVPYRQVLMHGFALDEKGRKMSKSLGNVVEPMEVVEKYGADSLRFYVLSNPPWEDLKFSVKGLTEVQRLLITLWNVHVFATTYMSLDSFDPEELKPDVLQHLKVEDRWILSKVNTLVATVTSALERYDIHVAVRALANFIQEDLSRWYVRLIRRRTWIEKEDPSKTAAYFTLHRVLVVLSKLLAPFVPHISERIYQELGGGESVHLSDWPKPDEEFIDRALEEAMEIVRKLVEAGSAARQAASIKLRWPVRTVLVETSPEVREKIAPLQEILSFALNCKELVLCGPGEKTPPKQAAVGESIYGRVIVDTELTEELRAEALVREIVRRFQVMRKEMSLEMEERVDAEVCMKTESLELIKRMVDYIKREVRIRNLHLSSTPQFAGFRKEFDLDGEVCVLTLRKI